MADFDILEFILIPLTSAIVGYVTNVVALRMTFYPLEYVGCLQIPGQPFGCGWQGIIPNKAVKMAEKAVDLMTEKLISMEEMFSRLDPNLIAAELEPAMVRIISSTVMEVASSESPEIWELLPQHIKQEIINKACEDVPPYVADIMTEVKNNFHDVFDIKETVTKALVEDKDLLNRIFQQCGEKEFVFIERSGFYLGGMLGFIQAIVWIFYQDAWVLPVFGLINGWVTNYIALKIIFLPIEPIYFCGFKIQGLFLKRQQEVADIYAQLVAAEVLTPKQIVDGLIFGKGSDNMMKIVRRHVNRAIDAAGGVARPFIQISMGSKTYENIKKRICDGVVADMPNSMPYMHGILGDSLDIENTLREKMQSLSPAEFEQALHPVFEEDEIKLILVGAVLGCLVGVGQIFTLDYI
eukprot:TRINITY_DN6901_c0_g1_i1.p1 TRINITY_DN6901_c0_g1~~TRINITY_DN6901_c0_g1_i1.p1  ORF type:complete len:409 (-),score=95.06 TRINITY_DN6901_c0_g1_i1:201-1427(-)